MWPSPKLIGVLTSILVVTALVFYISVLKVRVSSEQVSHAESKVAIATAQVAATQQQEQRNQQVDAAEERIDNEAVTSYRNRIAALERQHQLDGLRLAGATAERDASRADVSTLSATACRTDEAASDRDALAIQLDELITWNEKQHALDPNAPPKE